jgi:pimeloyl-ACP methyl ester carboxylesterase
MQPTIVLVHGAFAESASWDGVIDPLTSAGHTVIAAANPLRGLASDAAAVSDLVRTIDGPVVLAAHSYGGAVITNVAADAGEIVRPGLRQRFRARARRERFYARGQVPGQHARRGDGAAGPAQRREDRPVHRHRPLP